VCYVLQRRLAHLGVHHVLAFRQQRFAGSTDVDADLCVLIQTCVYVSSSYGVLRRMVVDAGATEVSPELPTGESDQLPLSESSTLRG
jgi:hypothetical protein